MMVQWWNKWSRFKMNTMINNNMVSLILLNSQAAMLFVFCFRKQRMMTWFLHLMVPESSWLSKFPSMTPDPLALGLASKEIDQRRTTQTWASLWSLSSMEGQHLRWVHFISSPSACVYISGMRGTNELGGGKKAGVPMESFSIRCLGFTFVQHLLLAKKVAPI